MYKRHLKNIYLIINIGAFFSIYGGIFETNRNIQSIKNKAVLAVTGKLKKWKNGEISMPELMLAIIAANYVGDKINKKLNITNSIKQFIKDKSLEKFNKWKNGEFSTADMATIGVMGASTITGYLVNKKYKVVKSMKNKCGNYVASFVGPEKMDPEFERYCQEIVKELGMDSSIEFRKMGSWASRTMGQNNAFVLPFMNYVFIGDFFKDLTFKERRFLIGHELMHIDKRHGAKHVSLILLASLIVSKIDKYYTGYITNKVASVFSQETQEKYFKDTKLSKYIIPAISRMPISLGISASNFALKRYQEREADRETARRLGPSAIMGGIALFKRFKALHAHLDSLSPALKTILNLTSTHPSDDERIKALAGQLKTNIFVAA
jgi:Zn-dependent protease with chaperone function